MRLPKRRAPTSADDGGETEGALVMDMRERWIAHNYGERGRAKCSVSTESGEAVCSVNGGFQRASLIAAAPDLARLFKQFVQWREGLVAEPDYDECIALLRAIEPEDGQ